MVPHKARCGSVEASRAGNPEEGGSSPVGGQSVFVGGYVRLGYWEVAASLFYNFFNIQNKIKNKIMLKNQILA